jgi:hypothetical protein
MSQSLQPRQKVAPQVSVGNLNTTKKRVPLPGRHSNNYGFGLRGCSIPGAS